MIMVEIGDPQGLSVSLILFVIFLNKYSKWWKKT